MEARRHTSSFEEEDDLERQALELLDDLDGPSWRSSPEPGISGEGPKVAPPAEALHTDALLAELLQASEGPVRGQPPRPPSGTCGPGNGTYGRAGPYHAGGGGEEDKDEELFCLRRGARGGGGNTPEGDAEFARRLQEELDWQPAEAVVADGLRGSAGDGGWNTEVDDLLLALQLQAEEEAEARRASPRRGGGGAGGAPTGMGRRGPGPELSGGGGAGGADEVARGGTGGVAAAGLASASRWADNVDDLLLALELSAGNAVPEAGGPPQPPGGDVAALS